MLSFFNAYLLSRSLGAIFLLSFASSLSAATVPADKFDLKEWNITLPLDQDGNKKADIVSVKDLQSYQHPDFFYLDGDNGMVFTSPNKATSTPNSSNTRSELRHMLRGMNTKIDTTDPRNNFALASHPQSEDFARIGGKMNATLKVNHVAKRSKYPEKLSAFSVVVGQIHAIKFKKPFDGYGWGNESLKIFYKKWPGHETGSVFWTYEKNLAKEDPKRKDVAYPVWGNLWADSSAPGAKGVALGEEFSYEVNVYQDEMHLTFTAEGRAPVYYTINLANNVDAYGQVDEDDFANGYKGDWLYFKAGAYNQCSTTNVGCLGTGKWQEDEANGDYTQVTFSKLKVGEAEKPTAQGKKQQIGATLNKKVALALNQIPQSALKAIASIQPKFVAQEVEKEFKHGNEYLDVEGKLSDGSEIEFDMLKTKSGWQVVEIQRDLVWKQLPSIITDALTADSPNFKPRRIIESIQHGQDITVYEFYAVDHAGKESRKEVKLEAGKAEVLKQEWQH